MSDAYAISASSRVFFGPASITFQADRMTQFTHIVNCDSTVESTCIDGPLKPFLFLQSFDEDTFPILDLHFDRLCLFIDTALTDPDAAVYIHCRQGMNRSAALAVAYACRATGEPAASLITTTRMVTKRLILTNKGFESQLLERFSAV
jgi:hypothetical protein